MGNDQGSTAGGGKYETVNDGKAAHAKVNGFAGGDGKSATGGAAPRPKSPPGKSDHHLTVGGGGGGTPGSGAAGKLASPRVSLVGTPVGGAAASSGAGAAAGAGAGAGAGAAGGMQRRGERKKYKVLFLGASESGKSTIFKQLINAYAKNHWSDSERLSYLPIMHENMVSNMKLLIEYVRAHSKKQRNNNNNTSSSKQQQQNNTNNNNAYDDPYYQLPPVPPFDAHHDELAYHVSELRKDDISGVPLQVIRHGLAQVLEPGMIEMICQYYGMDLGPVWDKIASLWSTPSILAAFGQARSVLNLTDSAKYFFDRIREVTHDDYIPSPSDVLRVLHRTTGLVEGEFEVDHHNVFHVYDLGGSRDQRSKWIHVYEDVDAYVYVAAVSEYDQLMTEDDTTNRLIESLQLFERDVAGNRWFRNSTKILLLTKQDVFYDKFTSQKIPLTVCFPEYENPGVSAANAHTAGAADHAMQYILEQFESHAREKGITNLNSYVFDALAQHQITNILNGVKAAILHEAVNKDED